MKERIPYVGVEPAHTFGEVYFQQALKKAIKSKRLL